jgi:hypothetical protein
MSGNLELLRVTGGKLQVFYKAWAVAHIGIEVILGAKLLNCWQVGEFAKPIGRVIGAVVATIEAGFHGGIS